MSRHVAPRIVRFIPALALVEFDCSRVLLTPHFLNRGGPTPFVRVQQASPAYLFPELLILYKLANLQLKTSCSRSNSISTGVATTADMHMSRHVLVDIPNLREPMLEQYHQEHITVR